MLSDQLLLYILSQSKDAVAVYDSFDLNIRFANEAMCAFWGKGNGVVGNTLGNAVPELEGQPFLGLLQTVWTTGITYQATDTPATLLVESEMKTFYFDFEYRAILDENNDVIAILHTANDVTGRVMARLQLEEKQQREDELMSKLMVSNKNIQDANAHLLAANRDLIASTADISRLNERLLESETNFRRLVEQAPVAIMVFSSEEMVIELANELMLEILVKDASVIGHPILVSMPELKGEPAVELIFDAFRQGKEFDGNEVPVRMMRNGKSEIRYFNFSYRPLRDGGHIIGVMDLAVEVTDQVLARKQLEAIISEKTLLEKNLRSNERRLQSILDTMAEGVVICDIEGNTIYANLMAQKIMGVSEGQFLQHSFFNPDWKNEGVDGTLLHKEDHPMFAVLRTGLSFYEQEIAVVMPGRDKLYISLNAAPLVDVDDQITGCTVTFTDVTNRIKILQQKDDFISVASHELKTPLTTLKATLQMLGQLVVEAPEETISILVNQANRSMNKLSDLVNTLLNSNRVSEGRFPLHKTEFNIATLINECSQHISTAGKHQIHFSGDLSLMVTADEQLIEQVIVNFVNNAVKYAQDSKQISVNISSANDYVQVSISDSGPGIASEKLPYIFDRYYRADQSGSSIPGLGLGLYIAAEIIYKHGGQIGVESELGQGATFWFTLPL